MSKLLLLLGLLAGSGIAAVAQQRDPTFHNAHFQRDTLNPGVTLLARQADGRYLVAGNFLTVDGFATRYVARLWPNGRVDSSFAGGGAPTGSVGLPSALAVQADGRVLVAWPGAAPPLQRLLPTGQPDASFVPDTSGGLGRHDCRALAIQADGRIVLGGPQALVRLLPDGRRDPAFQPSPLGPAALVQRLLLEPDGRITYLAINQTYFSNGEVQVGRLLPTGQPDPTFTSPQFIASHANDLRRLPNGGYLLAGTVRANGRYSDVLRLSATGAVDSTLYASLGSSIANPFRSSALTSIAPLADGSFLAAGELSVWMQPHAPLQSYAATGTNDNRIAGRLIDTPDSIYFPPIGMRPGYMSYINNARVQHLLTDSTGTLVVGRFSRAGGQPSYGLTRLVMARSLTIQPAAAARLLEAWPLPAHDRLYLRLPQPAALRRIELLDALGRPARAIAHSAEPTLDLTGLPAGLYLLRARYADGQQLTRRIVVQ
ncbi:T9SS type A sorting domain-containing protein [Hymenobacter sp. ASUV-10]|uniref:T9SS type A sorting domain-containing protein n=1 Tax=Hymenobacter aranciens TaxID=3063996 RepID=A0ABT9B775_9BACT|nr:T9SS type A sorting domain-containing protein [Hymenobacter sp. ASUV-10]MDO7873503.1 T9SS type A sorting domain-containing protein [Hymenobacter sp. ASUV-10]